MCPNKFQRYSADAEKLSLWKVPIVEELLQTKSTVFFSGQSAPLLVGVFCSYARVLQALENRLRLTFGNLVEIVGSYRMSLEKRCGVLADIQKQKSTSQLRRTTLVLCTMSSVSSGTDLVFFNRVVCLNALYNREEALQVRGRLSRINQTEDQKLVFLFFRNTFETRLNQCNLTEIKMR